MDSIDGINWFELLVQICELQHWSYEIGNVNRDRTYIRVTYMGQTLTTSDGLFSLYAGFSRIAAELANIDVTQFLAKDLLINSIFGKVVTTLDPSTSFSVIPYGLSIEEIKLKLAVEEQ